MLANPSQIDDLLRYSIRKHEKKPPKRKREYMVHNKATGFNSSH